MPIFPLLNDLDKQIAINEVRKLPADGSYQLVIKKAGAKTDPQRGLEWKWYREISEAGVGGAYEDTPTGVHLVCKARFCVPILCEDDEAFRWLYRAYKRKWGHDPDRMRWFIEHQVHTEDLDREQMSRYLRGMQYYYTDRGVALTQPPDRRLLNYDQYPEARGGRP